MTGWVVLVGVLLDGLLLVIGKMVLVLDIVQIFCSIFG